MSNTSSFGVTEIGVVSVAALYFYYGVEDGRRRGSNHGTSWQELNDCESDSRLSVFNRIERCKMDVNLCIEKITGVGGTVK